MVLEVNGTTDLIDASVVNKNYDWIENIIKKQKPKIIIGGFSAPTSKIDMKLGEYAKKYNAKFGIWGPLPSALRDFLYE